MNAIQYLFEKSARLENDFVLGNRETISFTSLYEQSLKMANYLSDKNGNQKNILLVSNNNRFFLVCYFGIMLSGNVCVPLNPSIELENFDFIAKQCEAVLCFAEKKITSKLNLESINVITEQEYLDLIEHQAEFQIKNTFNPDLPAQIIFTSGSTGKQKGVVLSHKNIIANTNSIIEYLKLSEKDIIEVVLPFYYCYGLSLLHTHLRVGGSLVLNNNFILLGTVINDINKYKCTGLAGVPSHFQILLRKSDSFKKMQFPTLRYVTQAGGKLHKCFISEFNQSFPEIDFYVMYGQTEATARLSYLSPKLLKEKLGSIGKGIPNVQLKVVNEIGKQINAGEIGEIIAKGDNVMLGYYKDPESTKQTLKNGWLFTGDVGTIDTEGYIYLTARKKEIIKISGKRVSPKEIEEVFVSFPEVVDCTIEAIEDDITGEAIKATIVLKENANNYITKDILKSFCSQKLDRHKIPQFIEFSKGLKINSAGKKVKVVRENQT
ncbi:AMP-binding protein [uncultured Draconibacterium sp.]|uniref:AMP-binding protein n=1 Tax=uncultured Draconibacterium sp. TaxID=1573823 RepID=UPI002AA717A7|nr:AMP-binding protein [uncultured Draconibacterium sp.]